MRVRIQRLSRLWCEIWLRTDELRNDRLQPLLERECAASSDAASSHGPKMSKKTRQKARARAKVALSNRGRAHSNFTTAVASSRSRSSAVANISASVFASSKSVETISFSTLGTTLEMRFLLSATKTRKNTNLMLRHTAVLCWEICIESKMMMAIVLAKSIYSWRLHVLSFLTRVLQFFLPRPRPRISHLGILKALHRVARHKLTVFKFFRLPKRCNNCLTRF